MNAWITILINELLIPEVSRIIKNYYDTHHGNFPTEAEILAELEKNTSRYIQQGRDFLARTQPPPTPPTP